MRVLVSNQSNAAQSSPPLYTYLPPRVLRVSPANGSTTGGYNITITGHNLGVVGLVKERQRDSTTVLLGGHPVPVRDVLLHTHDTIVVVAPEWPQPTWAGANAASTQLEVCHAHSCAHYAPAQQQGGPALHRGTRIQGHRDT